MVEEQELQEEDASARKREVRQKLADTLLDGESEGDSVLEKVHPADVVDWLQDLEPDDARRAFARLGTAAQAEVIEYAEDPLQAVLIQGLSTRDIAKIVDELPADEGVDLLALVDDATTEKILGRVDLETAKELRELSSYPPDSAGGQMTTEFVAVPSGTRIGDLVKEIKHEGDEAGEAGSFVIDAEGRPVGYVSDRAILTNSIHDIVDDVMAEPFTITADADQEQAANLIRKYSLEALAVVDSAGRMLGILDADDASDVLEEEAEEDIHKIVGASPGEQTRLPILTRVRHRLPLQGLTVLGGLTTALILKHAQDAFGFKSDNEAASLLRFIPIVIGLAGNVGIQASTILVRAFATGEVEPDREANVLGNETLVGLLIGLVCGALTLPAAAMMHGDAGQRWLFGSAVGLAITSAVTWAAFLGCVVPMGCRRTGIDPAVVAGPFLITLSDVSGTAIFVSVAALILV